MRFSSPGSRSDRPSNAARRPRAPAGRGPSAPGRQGDRSLHHRSHRAPRCPAGGARISGTRTAPSYRRPGVEALAVLPQALPVVAGRPRSASPPGAAATSRQQAASCGRRRRSPPRRGAPGSGRRRAPAARTDRGDRSSGPRGRTGASPEDSLSSQARAASVTAVAERSVWGSNGPRPGRLQGRVVGGEALVQAVAAVEDEGGDEGRRPVAGVAQRLRQGPALRRQGRGAVHPHAVPRRVEAGHHRGVGRQGHGHRAHRVGEAHAHGRRGRPGSASRRPSGRSSPGGRPGWCPG